MRSPRLFLWLLVLGGCNLAFTPPIRGLHAGMPGRLAAGQLEVGGEAGGYQLGSSTALAPTLGGPHLSYGLTDRLAIEAGANLDVLVLSYFGWATGWAGVRLTQRTRLSQRAWLIGDVELGGGGGVGGSAGGTPSGQLLAAGLYEGVGLGVQWRGLGVYLRGRLDASGGDQAPTTLWPSALLGGEVRPVSWLAIGAGGGCAAYWNKHDGLVSGWFYQTQLTLIFDILGSGY